MDETIPCQGRRPEIITDVVRNSRNSDPSPDASRIGDVRLAEALREAALIAPYTEVEPDGAREGDDRGEPGREDERDADHVDDVPEIHRVARPGIDARTDQSLGRCTGEARSAAAEPDAIAAAQSVLQISPEHHRQKDELDVQRAERPFPCNGGKRQEDKGLYWRFA